MEKSSVILSATISKEKRSEERGFKIIVVRKKMRGWKFLLLNFEIIAIVDSNGCFRFFSKGGKREKFSLFSSSFAEKGFVERLGTHLYFTIGKTRVIRIEGIIFCSFDHFAFEIFIFPCRRDRAL